MRANKTIVTDPSERLFNGLPSEFMVGRYHSWTVVGATVPDSMTITAVDEQNNVMALAHKTYDVRGVQFHPESVLTQHGQQMLANWLNN